MGQLFGAASLYVINQTSNRILRMISFLIQTIVFWIKKKNQNYINIKKITAYNINKIKETKIGFLYKLYISAYFHNTLAFVSLILLILNTATLYY